MRSTRIIMAFMLLWGGIVWLSPSAAFCASIVSFDYEAIDEYVRSEMKAGGIPGLSIAVVRGNEVLYAQGYGRADSNGTPVTPQTMFQTGSVGKTFTALAIRQLANRGLLDVKRPVRDYIPWFSLEDSDHSPVRIDSLLYHTSGFSERSGNKAYTYNVDYTIEELVTEINRREKLNRLTGQTFEYSNLNFVVLGLVIEYVSGMPYDVYIREYVFNPLHMQRSYASEEGWHDAALTEGHRNLFGYAWETTFPYPTGQAPAGYHLASAEDMANYLIAYLNNGYYEGRSILPANPLPLKENPLETFDPNRGFYDAEWGIATAPIQGYNGFYGYLGATPNASSALLISQQTHYGIVVLANARSEYDSPAIWAQTIGNGISDLLYGRLPQRHDAPKRNAIVFVLPVLASAIAFYRLWTLVRFRKTVAGPRRRLGVGSWLALDASLPLAAYFGIPIYIDNSWEFIIGAKPEIGLPIFTLCCFLLVIAHAKAVMYLRLRRQPHYK